MSALAFQQVMAHLIRFPEAPLGEIVAEIGNLDLGEMDRDRLRRMAEDPLVRKFGRKMRFLRQVDATQVMRLSKGFARPERLARVYQEEFEPQRRSGELGMVGVQFLEFCLTDERSRGLFDDAEPFLRDLMAYDLAKARVERLPIVEDDPRLPRGSLLRHNAFAILDLEYDVPALDKAKADDPGSRQTPSPKAMKIIFLRADEPPFVRVFQIDEEIARFLLGQRVAPQTRDLPLVYPAMVAVGLCKALS